MITNRPMLWGQITEAPLPHFHFLIVATVCTVVVTALAAVAAVASACSGKRSARTARQSYLLPRQAKEEAEREARPHFQFYIQQTLTLDSDNCIRGSLAIANLSSRASVVINFLAEKPPQAVSAPDSLFKWDPPFRFALVLQPYDAKGLGELHMPLAGCAPTPLIFELCVVDGRGKKYPTEFRVEAAEPAQAD